EVVDDTELVGDLGTTEHHGVGALGVGGQLLENLDLGEHQSANGVGEFTGQVVDACVLAVDGAEGITHVQVRQLGETTGQLSAFGVVLAGLSRFETYVLQQGDLPVGEGGGGRAGGFPCGVTGEGDLGAQQLTQTGGDGTQGVTGVGGSLGAAQMGGDDDAGPLLTKLLNGRQGRADTPVVGDAVTVEGHVQVGPDEHACAGDVEVVDRSHAGLLGGLLFGPGPAAGALSSCACTPLPGCAHGGTPSPHSGAKGCRTAHANRWSRRSCLPAGADELGHIDQSAGVAPLVVVPAEDLDLVAEGHGHPRVQGAGGRGADDVGRDDRVLGVDQHVLERTFGRG